MAEARAIDAQAADGGSTWNSSSDDDLSGAYVARRQASDLAALRAEAEADIAAQGMAPAPQTDAPSDNGGGILDGAARVGMDVVRGMVETPSQVLGGVHDAGWNTARAVWNGLAEVSDWLEYAVPMGGLKFENGSVRVVGPRQLAEAGGTVRMGSAPEFLPAQSTTGGIVRGVAQFLTGFVPILGQIGKAAPAASAAGRVAQVEAAGALSSALVFDPLESRLSNLVEKVPALKNPVTGYLAADPDDGEAEGRFKNAVEGLVGGALAEGFVTGVRVLRASRIARGRAPEAAIAPEPEVLEPVVKALGSTEDPVVTPRAGGDVQRFIQTAATDDLPFQMNWARFTSSEEIEEAVTHMAQVFRSEIDEARRGKITDDNLKIMADRLGMTPQELMARNQGRAFNAEEILAAKTIVEASAEKLIELARVARTSTDAADLYAFRRMVDIHGGIQKQFQGAASEAGRSLRALQLPVGSRARQIQQIEAMLAQEGGDNSLRSMAMALSEINDPNQINRVVRDSVGKRATDALVEYWYFALLSGPHTHLVNMMSSSMTAMWQVPERALAAQFASLRGATDSVQAGEATEMLFGMAGAFQDGLRAMGRAWLTGEQSDILGKVEGRTRAAITAEKFGLEGEPGSIGWLVGKAVDGAGEVIRTPTLALMAEDEFFRVLSRSMQVRSLAFRQARSEGLEGEAAAARVVEIMHNPPAAMLDSALDFSQSVTFTAPLGDAGRSFSTAINKMPVFKVALPFIRTPVNLMKFVGTRSPLAPLARSVRADLARGGPAADLAAARLAMGTMLSFTAADLALRGMVTGSGPMDPELRAVWKNTHQPYSIKIGGAWYSYNRTDPFGMMMGIAADYAAIAGEVGERDAEELVGALALATSKSGLSKTWMHGVSTMVEALNDPDRYGERYLQQTLGTFLVPTGVAQTARSLDPVWRDVQSITDAIKARTPGYSSDLPARRNIWGEKIISEGGVGPDIISPIYKFGVKDSPIDEYLVTNRIGVQMPQRTLFGAELKPAEYERFVELSGNGLKDPATGLGAYDTLNAIIGGRHPLASAWTGATDGPEGGRAVIVRQVISSFREAARAQMLEEFPDLKSAVGGRYEDRQRALEQTILFPGSAR